MNRIKPKVFVAGLKLQGATCKNNTLELSSTISTELPLTSLRWIRFVLKLTSTFIDSVTENM